MIEIAGKIHVKLPTFTKIFNIVMFVEFSFGKQKWVSFNQVPEL